MVANIGDIVFVKEMVKSSCYKSVTGVIFSIKNGFANIKTESVKGKWSNEWKSHECYVSAPVDMCEKA